MGEDFHKVWIQLDDVGRTYTERSGPVPPRYAWLDKFMLPRIAAALPAKYTEMMKKEQREGKPTSVHGMLCALFMTFQPGGITECDEIDTKIRSPNLCSEVGVALRELSAWRCAVRRAQEMGNNLPPVSLMYKSATSIYKKCLREFYVHCRVEFEVDVA